MEFNSEKILVNKNTDSKCFAYTNKKFLNDKETAINIMVIFS